MRPPDFGSSPLFLGPAELVVTSGPCRVKTVLGSCVAITMRAARLGVASMAHCLLPDAGAPVETLPRSEALRYVNSTIVLMLREFAVRRVQSADLEIQVFGGSDAFRSPYRVGRRNVDTALKTLATLGMRPLFSSVGGRHGRVVEFDTATGEASVKKLPSLTESACLHHDDVY